MWALRVKMSVAAIVLAASAMVVDASNPDAPLEDRSLDSVRTEVATDLDGVSGYGTDPLIGLTDLREVTPRPYDFEGGLGALRAAEECCPIGVTSQQPSLSRFFHGNVIEIEEEAELTEIKVELDFAFQADLTFVVYRRDMGATAYTPIFVQPATRNGTGLGLYVFDIPGGLTLTPNLNGGVPQPTRFLVGIGWDEAQSITFSRDSVNGAGPFCRGEALGYWGINQTPPAPPLMNVPDLSVSIFTGAVMVMELCFEVPPGACCNGTSCSVVDEAACTGVFSEPGTTCDDVECPLPQGACCVPPDTCIFTNEFACESDFGGTFDPTETCAIPNPCAEPFGACCFFDGTCGDDLTVSECTDLGGSYNGDYSVCSSANCPATGACCLLETGCLQQESASECTSIGGVSFQGLGTHCQDEPLFPLDPCDDTIIGACCRYDGTCEDGVEQFDCETSQLGQTPGIWKGQGTDCSVQTCEVLGACCEDAETCSDVAIEDCNINFFTWTEGQPCLFDACGATVGACCVFGECKVMNSFDCLQAGGVFENVGTNAWRACEVATPCTNGGEGACCLPGGECKIQSAVECANSNGLYDGDGVSCASLSCVTGVCCDGSDVCSEERQFDCIGLGSTPGEPGTSCSDTSANPCVASGACCFDDGSCDILNETILVPQCSSMGGTYQGDDTLCDAAACPEVGACCSELVPGSGFFGCENDVSEPDCLQRPLGSFGGFGSDCSGDPCAQGACCALDGTCSETSRLACESDPLAVFNGGGTQCVIDACEPRGACCDGQSCSIETFDVCSNGGGAYLGDTTLCDANTCDTAPCCVSGECKDLFPDDCTTSNGVQGSLGDLCASGDFCTDGACCLGTSCFTAGGLHQLQCELLGGSFVGSGTDCSGDPCAPETVGCCVPGGSCQDLTDSGCAGVNGVSLGTDSDCATSNAFCSAEYGACCRPGNVCFTDDTIASCAAQSGTFLGIGTDCVGDPCAPDTVACCLPGASCQDLTEVDCTAQDGVSLGVGTDCASSNGLCPAELGACCLPGDTCSTDETPASCAGQSGSFLGTGTDCTGNPCAATGACCKLDGNCIDGGNQTACDAIGGATFSIGQACAAVSCLDVCSNSVPADFDNDGDADLEDYAGLQICMGGPTVAHPTIDDRCYCAFDINSNGAFEQSDLDAILPIFDLGDCVPFALQAAGDFDNDGDVDLIDFGSMQACVASGLSAPDPLTCRCIFDVDFSGVVDDADVSVFDDPGNGP
ncbi:MAG: hypothetical protein DHS20C16_03060 [Phycisphaerae bacterium]|nr:MAG: hypothetical protein DHS20C16_03060 [Phycisphaerae bacterium]